MTLNNRLGNEHLEYVYKTTVKHKSSKVAIATLNEKIVGHIVLSIDPLGLRKTLLKNRSLSKLAKVFFKLLINPSLFHQYILIENLKKLYIIKDSLLNHC